MTLSGYVTRHTSTLQCLCQQCSTLLRIVLFHRLRATISRGCFDLTELKNLVAGAGVKCGTKAIEPLRPCVSRTHARTRNQRTAASPCLFHAQNSAVTWFLPCTHHVSCAGSPSTMSTSSAVNGKNPSYTPNVSGCSSAFLRFCSSALGFRSPFSAFVDGVCGGAPLAGQQAAVLGAKHHVVRHGHTPVAAPCTRHRRWQWPCCAKLPPSRVPRSIPAICTQGFCGKGRARHEQGWGQGQGHGHGRIFSERACPPQRDTIYFSCLPIHL